MQQRSREELEEIEAELKRKTELLEEELEATKKRQRLLESQVNRMSRQNPQHIQFARSKREQMKQKGPRDLIHPSLPPMKSTRTPIRYRGIPQTVAKVTVATEPKLSATEPKSTATARTTIEPTTTAQVTEPTLFLELTSQSNPLLRELLEIPVGKEMTIGRDSWNDLSPEVKKYVHSTSYIVERRPGNDFIHVIAKRDGLMYELPNGSKPTAFPYIDNAAFRLKPNGTRIGLIAKDWDLTMRLVVRPD